MICGFAFSTKKLDCEDHGHVTCLALTTRRDETSKFGNHAGQGSREDFPTLSMGNLCFCILLVSISKKRRSSVEMLTAYLGTRIERGPMWPTLSLSVCLSAKRRQIPVSEASIQASEVATESTCTPKSSSQTQGLMVASHDSHETGLLTPE